MAKGRIDVYFHDSSEQPSEIENGQSVEGSNTSPKMTNKDTARSAVSTMAINYGKQIMTYGLSISGDLTGDYYSQMQTERFISNSATLMTMANFPYGTITGAISLTTQAISKFISLDKENKQVALYRERIGSETKNNSEVNE